LKNNDLEIGSTYMAGPLNDVLSICRDFMLQ